MMIRRSPVRSVLAERKLFANGGMLPISIPMQNNPAAGILSSSTPLIEAVTQDATNPMGGGTLSMSEGGAAVNDTDWGAMVNPPTTEGGTTNFLLNPFLPSVPIEPISTEEARFNMIFPPNRQDDWLGDYRPSPAGEAPWWKKSLFEDKPPTRLEKVGVIPVHAQRLLMGLANHYGDKIAGKVRTAYDYMLERTGDKALGWEKIQALNIMIASRPEYALELGQISDALMATEEGPQMDANEFRLAVSEAFYNRRLSETQHAGGASMDSTYPLAQNDTPAERLISQHPDHQTGLGAGASHNALMTLQAAAASGDPDRYKKAVQDFMSGPEPDTLKREVMERMDAAAGADAAAAAAADAAAFESQHYPLGDQGSRHEDITTGSSHSGDPDFAAAANGEDHSGEVTWAALSDFPGGKAEEDGGEGAGGEGAGGEGAGGEGAGGEVPVVPEEAGEVAADADDDVTDIEARRRAILDSASQDDPEATSALIQKHMEDFKSAVPEYEGMTEYEQGMALIKMAMAIAAGQSPRAIENIANGVLATMGDFTDDEKAKRDYKRQVGLSAGQYAIESVRKDRAAAAADLRNAKWLAFTEDYTDPVTGQEYNKWDVFRMSDADYLSGRFKDYPLGLPSMVQAQIDRETAGLKIIATADAAAAKALQIGEKGMAQLRASQSDHAEALTGVRNGHILVGLLDSIIISNVGEDGESKITGAYPWMKNQIDSLANAFDDTFLGDLDKLKYTDIKLYESRLQFVANRMIKELLGEGSRNISNIDRTLAEQIVGLLKDRNIIFASSEVMHENLQRIRGQLVQGIVDKYNVIDREENNWVERNFVGRLEGPTDQMIKERKRALKGSFEGFKSGRTGEEIVIDYKRLIDPESGRLIKNWEELLRS